jgi:hypothetical protein
MKIVQENLKVQESEPIGQIIRMISCLTDPAAFRYRPGTGHAFTMPLQAAIFLT